MSTLARCPYRHFGRIALLLGAVSFSACGFGHNAYAQTGGPSSPEFSGFESVSTTDMVDPFTGDFTYNLPVLNVPGPGGGYALSLSYKAGTSPTEEASWVGYGWTLSPGAIVRSRRGFPDDYHGDEVTYYNQVPKNWTASVGVGVAAEAFSFDLPLSADARLRYNNYRGFGYLAGLGASTPSGLASLRFEYGDGEHAFSATVNPAASLARISGRHAADESGSGRKANESALQRLQRGMNQNSLANSVLRQSSLSLVGSQYGVFTRAEAVRSTHVTPYEGESWNVSFSAQGNPAPLPIGVEVGRVFGNYSWQKSEKERSSKAYGYMYTASAGAEDVTDFYYEKDVPYEPRDRYLALPFANADQFIASGEGLQGGFRLHHRRIGHFSPNAAESSTEIYQGGVEVMAGADVGVGLDLGVGWQSLSVGSWGAGGGYAFDSSEAGVDESYFFRFDGDRGGEVSFGGDEPVQASIDGGGPVLDPLEIPLELEGAGDRVGRSSYIGFNTNAALTRTQPAGTRTIRPEAYAHDVAIAAHVRRDDPAIARGLGEFSIVNKDGTRYNYGLPVYGRGESNLQYGFEGGGRLEGGLLYGSVGSATMKVGEERTAPYATSFLLTSIASPDYLDRTLDGPTPDDFGAYVRFTYDQLHGTPALSGGKSEGEGWYRWRIPYTGLFYDRGELSEPMDDVGTVTFGEKEVYYLETVETKTHYARFFASNREDGLEAASPEDAANSSGARGAKRLRKLDRIELYARGQGGRPDSLIRTARFEYDYSLMPGTPNSAARGGGRLTLRRVWFEQGSVLNAKVSPYAFQYTYASPSGLNGYPDRYQDLDGYGQGLSENPAYEPASVDRWGAYRADGSARQDALNPWVSQNPDPSFDPAAWQLKRVELPSGGEIHVQYEQDDYAYVQDQRAHAMVPLAAVGDLGDDEGKAYLDLDALGWAERDAKERLLSLVHETYVEGGKKMYFRYLYALVGQQASLTECGSEYVTGYADVEAVGEDDRGVFVELAERDGPLGSPRGVCLDLARTQKHGKLGDDGQCSLSEGAGRLREAEKGEEAMEVVMSFVTMIGTIPPFDTGLFCQSVDAANSYLRLPAPAPKRGGGLRVKRLLMFDLGMEPGDEHLYGREYHYAVEDPEDGTAISSGVASMEPATGREENALVRFMAREEQGFLSKVVAGKDRKETEGPLGETVFPAPSVGYARIVIRDIHGGATNPGLAVREFHTYRDHPVRTEATGMKKDLDFLPIPLGIFNYVNNELRATQGFSVVDDGMHGQPKRVATYAGAYPSATGLIAWATDDAAWSLSSEQRFSYAAPDEDVPLYEGIGTAPSTGQPGREMEVVIASRKTEDVTTDMNVEGDGSIGLWGIIPIPFVSAMPSIGQYESRFFAHATTKLVRYSPTLLAVNEVRGGTTARREHAALSPATGEPIVVRTFDGYHGLDLERSQDHEGTYRTYTFEAYEAYPAMGPKAITEGRRLPSAPGLSLHVRFGGGGRQLVLDGTDSQTCTEAADLFTPGDLVEISKSTQILGYARVGDRRGNRFDLYSSTRYGSQVPLTDEVDLRIVRSGRTNELQVSSGGLTTYGRERAPRREEDEKELVHRRRLADALKGLREADGGYVGAVTDPDLFGNGRFGRRSYELGGQCIPGSDVEKIDLSGEAVGGVKLYVTYRDSKENGSSRCLSMLPSGGRFEVNDRTGQIEYTTSECGGARQEIPCLRICEPVGWYRLDGVVAAEAQTFTDVWPLSSTLRNLYKVSIPLSITNPYEAAEKGRWRLRANYAYRTDIVGANGPSQRVYAGAGVFERFTLFDHDVVKQREGAWLRLRETTQYEPNGTALEEYDFRGAYSAVRVSSLHQRPYLLAANASREAVLFESFEEGETSGTTLVLSDGLRISSSEGQIDERVAHAGSRSLRLQMQTSGIGREGHLTLSRIFPTLAEGPNAGGYVVKAWVRTEWSSVGFYADTLALEARPVDLASGTVTSAFPAVSFKPVARVGEWVLYEAKTSALEPGHAGTAIQISAKTGNPGFPTASFQASVWIDDVRVQPLAAEMTAHVYDPVTLRLVTTFDDQHFGVYYQYDSEGRLVREIRETERGMKTVREGHYHTPDMDRPPSR